MEKVKKCNNNQPKKKLKNCEYMRARTQNEVIENMNIKLENVSVAIHTYTHTRTLHTSQII